MRRNTRFSYDGRFCRRWLFTCTVLCVLPAAMSHASSGAVVDSVEAEVNTFIGTRDEGNTFPGASAPFGMIQVSPIGSHWAGWRYDDTQIRGMGHSFLSGAGCWEQGGQLSMLPVTGTIGPGGSFDTRRGSSFDHRNYAAAYTHEGEVGQAGYYRTRLTDYGGIDIEATALPRASAERYTFSPGMAQGHVLVNTGQATERHNVVASEIRVVGPQAVEGRVRTLSFCGGAQYDTWFRVEFDRPITAFGTWTPEGGTPGNAHSAGGWNALNGAWLSFDLRQGSTVTAYTAISMVDAEGARANLRAETQPRGVRTRFDAMRRQAQRNWYEALSRVRIGGGSRDERTVFHTAHYHALLQPTIGSDVDGRYRGYDNQIHKADGWVYHQYFSLWDSYRTQNQWIALTRPETARDIARSVLAIDAQAGWLPRWGYANFETNVMTGDPVTPFLVDLWHAGALRGEEQRAYAALRRNAFGIPPASSRSAGRSGNPQYLRDGFVQFDKRFPAKGMDADPHHGGSATMEYAFADCALSKLAAAVGATQDAEVLHARSGNWRRVWDAALRDPELDFVGFPHARLADGSFDPDNGSPSPRSDRGFHEGTAWQYQWLVPHDIGGLTRAMGGREAALKRLDAFFAFPAIQNDPVHAPRKEWVVGPYDYYNQYRYNPNNEPGLHTAWMYTLLGEPWKTSFVVRAAQNLFTNGPSGVTGNDDLGTMSAWYLFSALGFYPAVAGSGQFLLHAPRFEQVELQVGPGRRVMLIAPGASGARLQHVGRVRRDGAVQAPVWITWQQLRSSRVLQFDLLEQDQLPAWGRSREMLPDDMCGLSGSAISAASRTAVHVSGVADER